MKNVRGRRLLFFLAVLQTLAAEPPGDAPPETLSSYLEQIRRYKLEGEPARVEGLLRRARAAYRENPLIWSISGDFYLENRFPRLARQAYENAVRWTDLPRDKVSRLKDLASVQERLGEYQPAVDSYDQIRQLGTAADQNQAREKNGWLLLKLSRLSEARASIEAVEPEFRSDLTRMIQGMIYSASYQYEASKKVFEDSLARNRPDSGIRWAIYYNYAALEDRFMNYQSAMEWNQKSIAAAATSPNQQLLGEQLLLQRRFEEAEAALLKAYRLEQDKEWLEDRSPFPLLDLIALSTARGKYREGLSYWNSFRRDWPQGTDWMRFYDISSDYFTLQLTELRIDLYRGLIEQEKYTLSEDWGDWFRRQRRLAGYRFRLFRDRLQRRRLAYQVGLLYLENNREAEADHHFFEAGDGYPVLHRFFFRRYADRQRVLVPRAEVRLNLENAVLEADPNRLETVLSELDPVWDSEEIERAYIALGRLSSDGSERNRYFLRAYRRNPAALRNAGEKIPLRLELVGGDEPLRKRLVSSLEQGGVLVPTDPRTPALLLRIDRSDPAQEGILFDETGKVIQSFPTGDLQDRRTLTRFVNRLTRSANQT